jgi:amino acid adenylation domain-containing protein
MKTADVEDIYELSPLQHGILLHSQHGADTDMYVAQRSFRVHGRLDAAALTAAWQHVMSSYAVLRTSFHWEQLEKPLQVVHRTTRTAPDFLDWRAVPRAEQPQRLATFLEQDRSSRFAPETAPLTRLSLISLSDDEHELVWTHHMIILDGWSAPMVMRALIVSYRALLAGETPPAVAGPPYRRYIDWLQQQDAGRAEQYWAGTLDGVQPTLLSPQPATDSLAAGTEVAEHHVVLDGPTATALRETAARCRVTLNTVFQAAWALLLAQRTGTDDVMFGVTTSGRPAELPRIDTMAGLLINTLPLRLEVPERQSLGEWLRTVQDRLTELRRYEYTPLSRVKKLAGSRPGDEIFGSVLVFDSFPKLVDVDTMAGRLEFGAGSAFEKTSEPLTVMVSAESEVALRFLYHLGRFSPAGMAAIADHFGTVLRALVATPQTAVGDLAAASLVSAEEFDRIVVGWNDTARDYGVFGGLPGLLAERDGVAVVGPDGTELSYQRLWDLSGRVATELAARGAGPGSVVAVCAERSLELMVGLVAVVRAGAAFLPLDPSFPAERLNFLVADCGVRVVLAQRQFAGSVAAAEVLVVEDAAELPAGAPAVTVSGEDIAYVMYTSGSTGRPKGVAVSQGAVENRLLWMQETFPLAAGERVLQKTPVSFDVSVWELFWPLCVGATVVLAAPGGHRDSRYLVRQRVAVMHFVPSMLRLLLEEPEVGALADGGLRRVFCSGEALPLALVERFRQVLPDVELHNLYGPTEAAIDVTWWDCLQPGPAHTVPIGKPIANTAVFILDPRMRPVPIGVTGDLYLAGVQLAAGYVNQPGLTAEKFPANPLPVGGSRLYRTGDRARYLPSGDVEFLGRVDDQVKLRGQRIEPAEVDHTLAGLPGVRDSVTVVRTDRATGAYLATYAVTGEPPSSPAELRHYLAERLPPHAVPSVVTILDELPLSVNGKIDRSRLPAPELPVGERVAPRTPQEKVIAEIWQELLQVPEIGVDDNFFDLGGDSFAAVRAVRRIPGAGVALLLANPTPRELAAAVAAGIDTDGSLLVPLSPDAAAHENTPLLICVPFGGGSAASYVSLARALPPGLDVYAVALPGHEFGGHSAPQPVEEIAEACVRQLERFDGRPLSVYGHCMGVALATELTRRLEERGRVVDRLFLGGSYPFYQVKALGMDVGGLLSRDTPKANAKKLRYLRSLGGFDDALDEETAAFVMRNFHHDNSAARRYFTARWTGAAQAPGLRAPITFIAGDADPETPGFTGEYRTWERFSGSVELSVIRGGGHYFMKHHATELARIITERTKTDA